MLIFVTLLTNYYLVGCMGKVIRVSNEVYERLANRSKGFDTPNKVIEDILDMIENNNTVPSEADHLLRINKTPRIYAKRNAQSWANIESLLSKDRVATRGELVKACADHDHPAGGKGFVAYCLDNAWLKVVWPNQ